MQHGVSAPPQRAQHPSRPPLSQRALAPGPHRLVRPPPVRRVGQGDESRGGQTRGPAPQPGHHHAGHEGQRGPHRQPPPAPLGEFRPVLRVSPRRLCPGTGGKHRDDLRAWGSGGRARGTSSPYAPPPTTERRTPDPALPERAAVSSRPSPGPERGNRAIPRRRAAGTGPLEDRLTRRRTGHDQTCDLRSPERSLSVIGLHESLGGWRRLRHDRA